MSHLIYGPGNFKYAGGFALSSLLSARLLLLLSGRFASESWHASVQQQPLQRYLMIANCESPQRKKETHLARSSSFLYFFSCSRLVYLHDQHTRPSTAHTTREIKKKGVGGVVTKCYLSVLHVCLTSLKKKRV